METKQEREEMEDNTRIGAIGYIQAKKNLAGFWQLFFSGTRNEIFPGMKFDSAASARGYWKVQNARRQLRFDVDGKALTAKDSQELSTEITNSRQQIEDDYRIDEDTLKTFFNS